MSNGATDCSAVTHLRITDVACRVGEQWNMFGKDGRVFDIVMTCHCANGNVVTGIADV